MKAWLRLIRGWIRIQRGICPHCKGDIKPEIYCFVCANHAPGPADPITKLGWWLRYKEITHGRFKWGQIIHGKLGVDFMVIDELAEMEEALKEGKPYPGVDDYGGDG